MAPAGALILESLHGSKTMQTYDDLVDLVRICAKNAYIANSNEVAAVLWKMAVEYRDKAAKLDSRTVPDIGEPPPWLGS
jgi:hypothetical protein